MAPRHGASLVRHERGRTSLLEAYAWGTVIAIRTAQVLIVNVGGVRSANTTPTCGWASLPPESCSGKYTTSRNEAPGAEEKHLPSAAFAESSTRRFSRAGRPRCETAGSVPPCLRLPLPRSAP